MLFDDRSKGLWEQCDHNAKNRALILNCQAIMRGIKSKARIDVISICAMVIRKQDDLYRI